MESKPISCELRMTKDKKLSLRLWVSEEEKEEFLLEYGKQPIGLFDIMITRSGKK